uniref:Uncharacterized protein n=1 Tax=Trichobilharzia regenti TaxID=157069 RepID=A0AA85J3X2_TRIRE|nr:unnamed protein product [Trichobilharzia regenti]
MAVLDTSSESEIFYTQRQQKLSGRNLSWFLIDLVLMILTTTVIVIVFSALSYFSEFLRKYYVAYITSSLGLFLILLLVFVGKIRSQSVAVRLLLGITTVLWSVSLAAMFGSIYLKKGMISLVVTIMLTTIIVVLALKLPPINERGFIVFLSISMTLAVIAIVLKFCDKFIGNCVISILDEVFTGLFLIFVMFICLSGRKLIIWWFASINTEFILAFVVWFLIISLFAETYMTLNSCNSKTNQRHTGDDDLYSFIQI